MDAISSSHKTVRSRCCIKLRKRYCPRASKPQEIKVSGTFMPQKVRIALDAMGGDIGASVVVPGAAISLTRHPDTEFLLFGERTLIEAELAKHPALKQASRVIHTDVA